MCAKHTLGDEEQWRLRLFEKSPRRRNTLRHIELLLGQSDSFSCLAVGGDAVIHSHLAAGGGSWDHAAFSEEAVVELSGFVGSGVKRIKNNTLPYDDKQFDRLIIVGSLEEVVLHHEFIEECHRVLKDRGELIVNVRHAKSWGIIRPLHNLLGIDEGRPGQVRAGYTQRELFSVLKDGFDVGDIKSYSRFFLELNDALFQFIGGYVIGAGADEAARTIPTNAIYERAYRYFSAVYPLLWLADKLDYLLFFTRGYRLTALAKRRIWKPRRIPVLHDGRSIAEATLKTKIGTATPY